MVDTLVTQLVKAGGQWVLVIAILGYLVVAYFKKMSEEHRTRISELEQRHGSIAEKMLKLQKEKEDAVAEAHAAKEVALSEANQARLSDHIKVREILIEHTTRLMQVLAETNKAQEDTADVLDNLREQVQQLLRSENTKPRR